jgi:hypothetical protein
MFHGSFQNFYRRLEDGYPLIAANNIDVVDDRHSAEEAFVQKVIDTVNDLPNVLYEVSNETGSYSTAWQQHFNNFIRTYEGGKPFQHTVGFTFQYSDGSDSTPYSINVDWVSPQQEFPSNDGTRHVIEDNTDHSYVYATAVGLDDTTGTTTPTVGTGITSTAPREFKAAAVFSSNRSATSVAATNDYTLALTGTGSLGAVEYKIVSSTGTYSDDWSIGSSALAQELWLEGLKAN